MRYLSNKLTQAGLLALTVAVPAVTASGSIVTAEFLPANENNNYGVGGAFFAAQTFPVSQSGVIDEVSILLLPVDDAADRPDSITISIADTVAGVPNAILGSFTVDNPETPVDASFRPPGALYTVDFSGQAVSLLAGETYAWTVSGTGNTISVRGDFPGTYADGQGFESPDNGVSWFTGPIGDSGFVITVVPEPSSLIAFGLGGLLIARPRRSLTNPDDSVLASAAESTSPTGAAA